MTDPFRGGGFGSVGMGPFQTGGGGDSRYLIANDGDAVAQTRKYTAQIRWANGNITDDDYLAELRHYLGTTDKGSRERTAAQNEYDDAVYTIGRNKIVRQVNNAASAVSRVDALRRLIGYDRKRLSGMKQDNEQYRELTDRITDAEGQVREVRYGEMVRRFNRGKLSLSSLLSFAQAAAAASQGGPDHADWLDKVDNLRDQVANERLAQLYQDYEHERIPGTTVIDFLKERLSGMNPDSPEARDTARTIEDLTKQVREKGFAERDQEMARRVQAGTVSDADYVRYLHQRMDDYKPGSAEYRATRQTWLDGMFSVGESALQRQIEAGDAENVDLAKFYRGYMATMDPGSGRFLELQSRVNDLMVSGTSALALFGGAQGIGGYAGAGHLVSLTGQPGGTPVNAAGFASQFDGSAFAGANCWAASAAMAAWQATGGKRAVSGGDIRYYSGDRDGGGTYEGVAIAYRQLGLGLRELHDMSFDAFTRKLLNGQGAMLAGSYADMDPRFKHGSTFMGPHSIFISKAKYQKGQLWFLVMDPIARSAAEGQVWMPAQSLKAFGWSKSRNEGGGIWNGDVGFVSGSKHVIVNGDSPPFQAFDTDAQGNSTIGRGGGKDRIEAGPRRDWSKGRHKEPDKPNDWPSRTRATTDDDRPLPSQRGKPRSTVTDGMVSEFLAAIDSTAPSPLEALQMKDGRPTPASAEKDARARALLGEYGGDARLAAIAWFTGSATTDTGQWTATQRFYANAVGTRLGYESIPKGGVGDIDPMKPPSPLDLTTTPKPVPVQESGRQTDLSVKVDDLAPEAANIGRMLLQKLGIEPTPDMIRAVVAWVSTEGTTVKGNNPLLLKTTGMNDLPGQVGRDADGYAVFGTLEDGIAASAKEIASGYPGLVAAARSGDPERFLVGVERSGWAPYSGALVRTYNEIPGTGRRIISSGGQLGSMFGAATDIRSLAAQEPSIAELFDVDPRDPVQMKWLEANVESAKAARESGASSWVFYTPGMQPITLDFSPGMAADLTGTKAQYLDWMKVNAPTLEARDKATTAAASAWEDHNVGLTEVAVDEWDAHMDALKRVRDAAYGKGDFATALTAVRQMQSATSLFLGLDPNAPLDANQSPRAALLDKAGEWDKVVSAVDRLDARSPENPSGDPMLSLMEKGYVQPQFDSKGNLTSMVVPPEVAYTAWGADGTPEIRTVETHPTDFDESPVEVAQPDGTIRNPPAYTQKNVLITIDGVSAYAPVAGGDIRTAVIDSFDYRVAEMPATAGAAPGSITGINLNIGYANPFGSGATESAPGGVANISSWQMGPQQPSRIIDVTPREDRQYRVSGTTRTPVSKVTVMDPRTHKPVIWYSIPGSGKWVGGTLDQFQNNPPTLVLGANGGRVPKIVNGELQVDGVKYDPAQHGPIEGYVHWYGDRPEDGAKPGEYGAPGSRWRVRQATPTPGGGQTFDTAPPDTLTAFLEGDIALTSLIGARGIPASRPPDKSDRSVGRTRDNVQIQNAWVDPPLGSSALGSSISGAAAARTAMQGLADMGYFDNPEPPAIAGATPVGTPPVRPGSMVALSTRMTAGVRSFADAALKVAAATKQAADAQAAQNARIAQQAAAAESLRRSTIPTPRNLPDPVTPRTPTGPRGPRGPQGPSSLPSDAYGPQPAQPRPTPPPPLQQPDGRTRVLDGGV